MKRLHPLATEVSARHAGGGEMRPPRGMRQDRRACGAAKACRMAGADRAMGPVKKRVTQ